MNNLMRKENMQPYNPVAPRSWNILWGILWRLGEYGALGARFAEYSESTPQIISGIHFKI